MIVSGNTIQTNQGYGIYVTYGDGAMEITKNKVNVSTGHGIYLYVCDGGVLPTGTPGLVANNFVTINSNTYRGIYLYSTTRQNVYYNSVNSLYGTDSRSFDAYACSDINVVNNIFANHGGGYAYVSNSASAIVASDYNNIYSPGNYLAYLGTSYFTTLADLQASSGKDANSLSVYPHYTANDDLHTVAPWLDGVGTALTEVTDDIDGEARGGTPDIGADQFVPDPATTTPLSGTFTIGSGGDYSDFAAASADLLLKGISAPVTFNVMSGNYNEQVIFHETPGASATDTITFQSQSGSAADVLLWHFAAGSSDNFIVLLRGSDYMRFRNMTYMTNNVTPVSYGKIFYIWHGVEDLVIEDNIFNGSPTTSSSADLSLIYSTGMLSSPRVIRNNTFNDGGYSIYLQGVNTTTLSSGTEVIGNTINNAAYGMYFYYQEDMIVSGNTIQTNQGYGIYVTYGDGAMEITKNKVNVSTGHGIYLYVCDGGVLPTGTPGLVANNFVTINSNTYRGIYLYSTTRQNVYYNSVNSLYGTDSRSFDAYACSDINVVNNIFANHGGGYAYVSNSASAIVASDYNDLFTTGVNLAYLGTSNFIDLAALQAASGKDANSISIDPQFISTTNLHTTSAEIDSAATSLVEVIDDIDGELRDNLFPDIGADEVIFGINSTPVITSNPDTLVRADSLYEYQVTAIDPDGDTLTYHLLISPAFLSIDTTTGLIQGTPTQGDVGDHPVSIEVNDGKGGTTNQIFTLHVQPPLGIDDFENKIPTVFDLKQNYPNPFNPTTTIEYDLPKSSQVKIEIYNLLGKKVKTILDVYKNAGSHKFVFDSNNLASGVYLYRIQADTYTNSKKMILMR